MTEREALKLALEAFEHFYSYGYDRVMCEKAIIEIKEALAQPEQLFEENERLHVENRRLIDRIETIGVPVGVGGFATTTTQSEQEPVAFRYRMPVEDGYWVWNYATYIDEPKDQRCEPLYTTPPTQCKHCLQRSKDEL